MAQPDREGNVGKQTQTVVIVGGAIIGSFAAYYLRKLGFDGQISVIEADPSYARSSTALSAASIRTQFGCAINIHMSLFAADLFRNITREFGADADIGFVEQGYLIIASEAQKAERQAAVRMQNAEGASIAALSPDEARARFPWLNASDIGLATYGLKNEGWFDAWSLLQLVRRAARDLGVNYVTGHVDAIEVQGTKATGVRMDDGTHVPADWCINAAGPMAARIVRDIVPGFPVEPRKRTVFSLKTPLSGTGFPMLFDDSGAWIRPEGQGFIAGIAPAADQDPDATGDFEPAHDLLEDVLWPALAHRVPVLEDLRVERSWAGHYEVNFLDHNAIIGPHDEIGNLVFMNGFSGHGVMHAPAAGRGIAEHILTGQYRTLDLSPLGFERIRAGRKLHETVVY
ncbi:FAD-binding oxidoreductase [Komagataeibacter sp. FNDCF1]|uniref:NAD(P)/FAD-dependent oxidoreductase n=1 Tax=Komagataeibacter sp. FNDCF1 TaxID=2878681 RepID=UPI001E647995|nr:FAD-binding oxidoreductase [Komagataeibacter sp. FNDCF1]MCE2563296.1 FAD-binding oxidoreductase [Komagataeibacter sp. FNDCF1]